MKYVCSVCGYVYDEEKRAYRLLNYLMDGRVPYVGPTKGHLHRRLLRNQPLLL